MQNRKRKIILWLLISLCIIIIAFFIFLILLNSSYLNWNYNDPQKAVMGVAFHSFEWIFIRIAPIIIVGLIVGILFIKKKKM